MRRALFAQLRLLISCPLQQHATAIFPSSLASQMRQKFLKLSIHAALYSVQCQRRPERRRVTNSVDRYDSYMRYTTARLLGSNRHGIQCTHVRWHTGTIVMEYMLTVRSRSERNLSLNKCTAGRLKPDCAASIIN
jgi:hypothetical protein